MNQELNSRSHEIAVSVFLGCGIEIYERGTQEARTELVMRLVHESSI